MDEPTTALDVVVQREILQKIYALKEEFGFSILFITHDLSLMVEFSDRIGIMYSGELIEALLMAIRYLWQTRYDIREKQILKISEELDRYYEWAKPRRCSARRPE